MPDHVHRAARRANPYGHALTFQFQDLVENKSFGEPWEHFQDEPDSCGRARFHSVTCSFTVMVALIDCSSAFLSELSAAIFSRNAAALRPPPKFSSALVLA